MPNYCRGIGSTESASGRLICSRYAAVLGVGLHTFLILFTEAYPINVINNVRSVSEVAVIYCATSNPVQAIVAKAGDGRSVIGIVDGVSSRAIESWSDKQNRSKLLRDLGYKRS